MQSTVLNWWKTSYTSLLTNLLSIIRKAADQFASLAASTRIAISSIAAFIGYGSWAYLVNLLHGQAAALKSFLVQGGYSFLMTLVMTTAIEGLYRFFSNLSSRKVAAMLTVVLVCLTIYITSWTVNSLAATPEIFRTVILGYIISTIYTISYVLGLLHQSR